MSIRIILFLLATTSFVACNSSQSAGDDREPQSVDSDTGSVALIPAKSVSETARPKLVIGDTSSPENSIEEFYPIFYLIIADTGQEYRPLQQLMFQLAKNHKIDIDTMGRTWYSEKNLIALPEDDEDEIYAGEYISRNLPDGAMSIEYLNAFHKGSTEKKMALIAGIFESKDAAMERAGTIQPSVPGVYVLMTTVYAGCRH